MLRVAMFISTKLWKTWPSQLVVKVFSIIKNDLTICRFPKMEYPHIIQNWNPCFWVSHILRNLHIIDIILIWGRVSPSFQPRNPSLRWSNPAKRCDTIEVKALGRFLAHSPQFFFHFFSTMCFPYVSNFSYIFSHTSRFHVFSWKGVRGSLGTATAGGVASCLFLWACHWRKHDRGTAKKGKKKSWHLKHQPGPWDAKYPSSNCSNPWHKNHVPAAFECKCALQKWQIHVFQKKQMYLNLGVQTNYRLCSS